MKTDPQLKPPFSRLSPSLEEHDPPATCEVDECMAALDLGYSPSDMLVIREVIWSRVVGFLVGLALGLPMAWVSVIVARRFDDLLAALLFASIACVPLGGSLALFAQILNRNFYYVALDHQLFLRRWGPRKFVAISLKELDSFAARAGAVLVQHRTTGRKIIIMKDAYSPERLNPLADRLNAWRKAPAQQRSSLMAEMDVRESRDARKEANDWIIVGLALACFCPLLLTLSIKLHLDGPLQSLAGAFFTLCGLYCLGGGIVKRFAAPLPFHHYDPIPRALSRTSKSSSR